jgi:hypothetical protein
MNVFIINVCKHSVQLKMHFLLGKVNVSSWKVVDRKGSLAAEDYMLASENAFLTDT